MSLNLNHLAIFHAVAEEKSVTGASRRLLVSQPAISKQLGQLEKSLGVKLFDRQPRGVRATEAGRILATYASRIFTLAEDGERAVGELRGLKRGRLRVGASTTIGVYFLPEMFVRFRAAHPGIQLELQIASSEILAERLIGGSIDVGFTEGVIANELLDPREFMVDRLVAIAPYRHPLARKRSLSAEALCREPFVVRETGSDSQSLVERSLAGRGLRLRPVMSLGSTEAIKRAVMSGVGVAVVSSLAIDLEVKAKKLAILRVRDLNIRRPVHRVMLRDACQSPGLKAFVEMVESRKV